MQTQQNNDRGLKAQGISKNAKIGKTVRLGTIDHMNIFCRIEYKNERLSITGVEGPMSNGNAKGSCGQIVMHLRKEQHKIQLAPQWNTSMLAEFFAVWDRWHLNDMRAGSPVQEEWLRNNPIPESEYKYPKSHYEVASAKLSEAGISPDANGYKYGHAWKFEAIPDSVLAFLGSLPETDIQPAWV